ncbi:MAG: right-handed parallel beta-helix repeat-containing protein, partial [Kiritimatiellae bacterium]|nr:right-handed parallel beta-helix repeat-containing protein [Kiritimatiellia bacterium]
MHSKMSFFKKPVLIGWLLLAALGAQAATYYVSPAGSDANNGTSWVLAKQTIQAGINVATSGDTILVADGTYMLTNQISISRGVTVRSVNGAQATILNGNGVTPCALLHPNAVLDGFIVTNGYSSSFYGGIYAYGGTVQNCTISGNFGDWVGGVNVENGIVQNCTISGNTAYNWGDGGGVFAWNSTVQNCTISGNSAAYGGGVEAYYTTVENCTIRSNSASWDGGGVYLGEGTLRNCLISGNTVEVDGGGAFVYSSIVENCFISGNAAGWGGGLNTWDVTIQNCTISSNSAYESGGGISHWGGTVQYCTINENTANWGGGVGAWEPDAIIENCLISGNTATNGGGGALVAWGGTVQNCILSGNKAMAHEHPSFNFISPSCGGGVLAIWGGIVQNCQINGNWSGDFGGGVYAFESLVQSCTFNENVAYFDGGGACVGQGKLWNCLVRGNAAGDFGGGVYSYSSTVYNCTISGNTANDGWGLYNSDSNTVQNCIVYYNQNGDVNGTISNISYSCIGTEIESVGNITNEPQFVSIGSGYGTNLVSGNYRLQPDSPCLNAGTNQPWMENAVDLDGRPRVLRGVVDMGAYEGSQADIIIMRSPMILSNRCGYGSNATGQTIQVWNAGTGAMAYALSANVSWLSLSPASGTSMGETDLVSVNYVSTGLAIGSYTGIVTITSAEACNSPQVVTVVMWVDKVNQTITFPAVPGQVVTSQVGLAATASSGLPVSFAVASGPGTIAGGTNLTFTAAGTVRVVASQAGNAIYHPAPNVTIAVAVERISQTITFPAIPAQAVTSQVRLAATASSGLPVSFAVASGPGTISGGTNLSFTAVGTVWVVASQAGNAIYHPAPNVTNAVAFVRIGQTIYVSPAGNDANNGTSWALAKQTIQAGINVATVGDTVLVADGTYGPITIPPGITVRSVNGARVTTIDGGGVTRCAYLYANTVLDGFTVTNGYSSSAYGGGVYVAGGTVQNCTISGNTAYRGGGVCVRDGTVQNCTISGNAAYRGGGGVYAYNGTVENCTISGNTATHYDPNMYPYGCGGGMLAYGSTVENCTISGNASFWGGGMYLGNNTVRNCTISGNMSYYFGGGVDISGGTMQNCTINGNTCSYYGGGVNSSGGTVQNCTISGNTAIWGGGVCGGGVVQSCTISGNMAESDFYGPDYGWGGGVYGGGIMVQNCTIVGNSASSGCGGVHAPGGMVQNCISYYNQNGDVYAPISYSCIGTYNAGAGNITNEPQFVSIGTGYGTNLVPGNYRLRPTSPCINAGLNQSWMTNAVDLDGLPRILGGVVDMGAYEWSGTNILIMRNPTILSNQCGYGSNATGQTLEVWNAGTGAIAYALSANVD